MKARHFGKRPTTEGAPSRHCGGGVSKLALLATLTLTVAACEVGPDYRRPEILLAPFHNARNLPYELPTQSVRLELWWTGFDDPVLTGLIDRALDANLDLAAAGARVLQARSTAQGATAQLLPTLDFSGSTTVLHQSLEGELGKVASAALPGYSRNLRDYTLGGLAGWEIDLFGGQQRAVESAEAEAQAAEAAQLGTRISVAAELADAYFQVRGDQARLVAASKSVEVTQHALRLVRERRDHGVSSDRDVSQSEALLEQTEALIPPLRSDLDAQSNRIDVLMGTQPGASAANFLKEDGFVGVRLRAPRGDQPVDLLRRRPDIIAAERRVAATNARIGAAIADYYPKISLVGALGLDSLSANRLFTS